MREICGNAHESSEIEKRRLSQFLVSTLNKIITQYRRAADHFALHREHLFAHL
jgi:hypothetical protein